MKVKTLFFIILIFILLTHTAWGSEFRVRPDVRVRLLNESIEPGQNAIVELYMKNPSANDAVMNVEARVILSSYLDIASADEGFGQSRAGILDGKFEVPPGIQKTANVVIKSFLPERGLFDWRSIPEDSYYNSKLIEFLEQKYSIDWVKTAKIEKLDNNMTIRVFTKKNSLSLRLNDEKTNVNLKIDDGRTDNLMANSELFISTIGRWSIDVEGLYYPGDSKDNSEKVYLSSPISVKEPTSVKPSASVELHGEKTDVALGEDIILKLSAVNLITSPVMTVQAILILPSGMSVASAEFVESGAGQYTTTYEMNPGKGRDIEVRIKTNQIGEFNVKGRIIYYYGNNKSTSEDHTLTLPIKVRTEEESKGSILPKSPGFIGVLAIISIFIISRLLSWRK